MAPSGENGLPAHSPAGYTVIASERSASDNSPPRARPPPPMTSAPPKDRVHHRQPKMRATQLSRIMARIYIAVAVLVVLIVSATVGFRYLGQPEASWSDALYMTLITITTVGYGEMVKIDSFGERVFAGLVALGGFGTLTFLFTSLSVFFLEGDLDYTLRRRRMEKQIRKLHNHYIICGFGRVGRNVANELSITNRHYVAIDSEENRLEEAQEKFPGLLYLAGDASDDDLLLAAYIEDAKGVFAVTGDDSRNLMFTLTAKQLNPKVRVIARSNDVRNSAKMRKAGADSVVSPDFTGGMRIAAAMVRPHVVSFLDEMLRSEHKLRVEEVVLPPEFPSCPLHSLKLHSANYVLLAVRTGGDWSFNPADDFMLRPGFILIAMSSPQGRMEIEAAVAAALDGTEA